MHRDLSVCFPDLRHSLEVADRATAGQFARRLSSFVYPPSAFSDEQRAQQLSELTDTVVAQPALGAVEKGLCDLLYRLGVRPDMTAGHSYGEYVALSVAGAFPADVLFALSAARGRAIKAAAGDHPGTMAAVSASPDAIRRVLEQPDDVWIANVNSPGQTVLAGGLDAIDEAVRTLTAAGLPARRIPVACAFHSPLVEGAGRAMAEILERTDIHTPAIPVFSNTLAAAYPSEPAQIRKILSEHITAPVQFAEQLEAMFQDGARIFVEIGPRTVLSNLARESLSSHRPLILSTDSPERHGITQLLHVLGQLAAAGVPIDFEELYRGRAIEAIQFAKLAPAEPLPRHVWMVNGGRARRQDDVITEVPRQSIAPAPAVQPEFISKDAKHPDPPVPGRINEISNPQSELMPSDSPNPIPQYVVGTGSDDVMHQFQQLMSQFLQTQALVMTAYLQGAPVSGLQTIPAMAAAPQRILAPQVAPPPNHSVQQTVTTASESTPAAAVPAAAVAPQPVAPPLKPAVPPPAPAVTAQAPAATARPAAVAPQARVSAADTLTRLLTIVSDRTGYPQEMLDADANIEADLGIDSIKRMEILTAFAQLHAGAQRGSFQGAMEKLTAIKTLRETASLLAELLADQAEAAVA
jgi:acyl transferase domain-containing protein